MPARRGEEYVINRARYFSCVFLGGKLIAQEMEWPSRRVQKLVYFVFKYFNHNDPSTQFLANCFENIVMATDNSGFNSTYVFACELRATGKRNKRKGIEQQ